MLNQSFQMHWNDTVGTNDTFQQLNTTLLTSGNQGSNDVFRNFKVTLHDWFLCLAFLIIMGTGILGNLLVIYVFGYVRRKKTKTTELLIIYLAVVDLLTSLFNPPLYIYWTLNKYNAWDFGWLGCKIIPAIGPVMTTASGWILLVFAVERYIAIVLPFYGKFNSKNVTILCLVSIVLSTLMYVHYIKALTYQGTACYVPDILVPDFGYPNCIFILVRLLAFLVIFTVTNIQIFLSLQRNESSLTVKGIKKNRNQQSKRIMRILFVMGIVFFVLVFPRELFYLAYNLSWMVDNENGIAFSQDLMHVNSWLKVMHTSNSCANVFIYAHMQTLYRRQIMKFLHFIRCSEYREGDINANGSMTETSATSPNINNSTYRHSRHSAKKFSTSATKRTVCQRKGDIFKGIPTKVFFHRAQQWKIVTDDARYDPMYL